MTERSLMLSDLSTNLSMLVGEYVSLLTNLIKIRVLNALSLFIIRFLNKGNI